MTQFRHRIGSALQRAAALDSRLATSTSPGGVAKIVEEWRRLVRQLEESFEDLLHAMSEQAEAKEQSEAIRQRGEIIFQLVPTPCVVIDRGGVVIDVNPAAAKLLNTSARFIVGRQFFLFLDGDRQAFLHFVQHLECGNEEQEVAVVIRPRERGAVAATVVVARNAQDEYLLVFRLDGDSAAAAHGRRGHSNRKAALEVGSTPPAPSALEGVEQLQDQ
jgi:PAS domain S-box-containing protein